MTRNASVGEKSVLSKDLRLSNGVTLSNRIAPILPNRTPLVGLAIMLATTLRDRLIVRIPALAGRRS